MTLINLKNIRLNKRSPVQKTTRKLGMGKSKLKIVVSSLEERFSGNNTYFTRE